MDQNDKQAIDGLFGKLAQVEQQSGPRDDEAEAFIRQRVAGQPAAPYFMAQTIVVQEQALNSAQQRIEELEYQMSQRASGGGGLLAGLFGSSAPRPQPRRPAPAPQAQAGNVTSGPWGQQAGAGSQRGGGGFLAGAAQTAMGVAGGVLLGNAIAGMFAGDAQAAEPDAAPEDQDFGGDEGMDDMDF